MRKAYKLISESLVIFIITCMIQLEIDTKFLSTLILNNVLPLQFILCAMSIWVMTVVATYCGKQIKNAWWATGTQMIATSFTVAFLLIDRKPDNLLILSLNKGIIIGLFVVTVYSFVTILKYVKETV